MSSQKKLVRQQFRNAVFIRDGNKCRICEWEPASDESLDAHHITDRNVMPEGGYVAENGISLCPGCHEKAEQFHSTGEAYPGMSPNDLYTIIGSSLELAREASQRLAKRSK